jgi:hypothetical protein
VSDGAFEGVSLGLLLGCGLAEGASEWMFVGAVEGVSDGASEGVSLGLQLG